MCTSWRDASRADALWKPLLEARFPRSTKIMGIFNSQSPRTRASTVTSSPESPPPDPFVGRRVATSRTMSLRSSSPEEQGRRAKIVESWTGRLEQTNNLGSYRVPLKWGAWMEAWNVRKNPNPLRLEVFASRCINGQYRTLPIFESDSEPDDGDASSVYFFSRPLRYDRSDDLIFGTDDNYIEPMVVRPSSLQRGHSRPRHWNHG